MNCDLHTHSVYSDGTWTPEELVKAAVKENLVLALTDHNTVSGLPDLLAAAEKHGAEVVPGIEFSTDFLGKEVHIVALFVRPESYDAIRNYVAAGDRAKEQSNRDLVRRLAEAGYEVDYDKIVAGTPDGRVNRAIIAAELVAQGYVESIKAAFKTLLSPKHGFYTPPQRPGAADTVAFIRSIGALPVLAHPLLSLPEEEVRMLLQEAAPKGLMAMETIYPSYDAAATALAKRMAAEFDLMESGGSDFHGDVKPDNPLGHPIIPRKIYEILKASME